MKPETVALLQSHHTNNKFKITPGDGQLLFDYDLTDDEIKAIVEAEYGPSLTGTADQLFEAIIKKLLKMGMEHAKTVQDA